MPRQKRHLYRVYQLIGEPDPGARVAGYVRYSSELQDPVSIVTQKRKIQEYCEHKGWVIVCWYEEPERSAKYEEIEQRPIFAQLLVDAGGEFQVVVCYMNNRWARNKVVAYVSLSRLRRAGIWWATSDGKWDIDRIEEDGWDIAYTNDVTQNAAYSRKTSEKVRIGKQTRAALGFHNGDISYGYDVPNYPPRPPHAHST